MQWFKALVGGPICHFFLFLHSHHICACSSMCISAILDDLFCILLPENVSSSHPLVSKEPLSTYSSHSRHDVFASITDISIFFSDWNMSGSVIILAPVHIAMIYHLKLLMPYFVLTEGGWRIDVMYPNWVGNLKLLAHDMFQILHQIKYCWSKL